MSGSLPQKTLDCLNGTGLRIAGVDEAGRGPLAGPVVSAAVILDPRHPIEGLADSKTLSAPRREALSRLILEHAVVGIGIAEPAEIDRLNILHATMAAMARAVARLRPCPDKVLIDGNRLPEGLPCPAQAIIGGDAIEPAISAASIVAKVLRDRLMTEAALRYPGYGFEGHKGYSCPAHRVGLATLGASPIHRRSYAPVRLALAAAESAHAADCG